MKTWMWIVGAIVVVALAVTAWVLLTPSPNVGDRAKLDRAFSPAEQQKLATVKVSSQELAAATCHNGAKCWIAVNGVVYDMGGFPSWARGEHHGVKAGADDTELFVRSGHAKVFLEKMPVVGTYAP